MNITEETYRIWAPEDSVWSAWTKPVLFMREPRRSADKTIVPPEADVTWATYIGGRTALIVDLPGNESVMTGLALAQIGYRPVALYNGVYGPNVSSMVVDVSGIVSNLFHSAGLLASCSLSPDAPPAFLLDSNRLLGKARQKGKFDNRWCVFPQDMPSASFLLERGINTVCVRTDKTQNDLAHILKRYQEKGIQIRRISSNGSAEELSILRPSWFRSVLYRMQTMAGLTKNAAGGFGSMVPEPTQSSSGKGYYRYG